MTPSDQSLALWAVRTALREQGLCILTQRRRDAILSRVEELMREANPQGGGGPGEERARPLGGGGPGEER